MSGIWPAHAMYRCNAEVRHLVVYRVSAEVAWRTVRWVGRRRLIVPSSCIPFFQPKFFNTQVTPLLPVQTGVLGRGEEQVGWGMDSRHCLGMDCHRNSTACCAGGDVWCRRKFWRSWHGSPMVQMSGAVAALRHHQV